MFMFRMADRNTTEAEIAEAGYFGTRGGGKKAAYPMVSGI